MNGKEILQTAHQMAGLSYLAEDSAVVLDASGIKKVAAGMDVGTAELMLAKDAGADMLIAHHATFAPGCLDGYKSLSILLERMVALGAPPAPASKIIHTVQDRVRRGRQGNSSNYDRAPSIARLISMPLMSLQTPLCLVGSRIVQNALSEHLAAIEEPRLADVMDGLMTLPESRKSISPPALYVGATDDYAGKPVVLFAHEAAEYPEIALELFEAGVGTLVLPYASEAVVAAVKEQNIGNLAVMGHVTADSIGINAFLSYLEGQGAEVIRMSGVINVREEA